MLMLYGDRQTTLSLCRHEKLVERWRRRLVQAATPILGLK
jgi:hypothetical protein